jgi:hypothetical protein
VSITTLSSCNFFSKKDAFSFGGTKNNYYLCTRKTEQAVSGALVQLG